MIVHRSSRAVDSFRRRRAMTERTRAPISCPRCKGKVKKSTDFCPHCGHLFAAEAKCAHHKSSPAVGVCVICSLPLCRKCGSFVVKVFLCAEHEEYEVYEGMARVFGASDVSAAEYVLQCLKQVGLHPFLYSRKASAISVGGPEHTCFRASGEYSEKCPPRRKMSMKPSPP